MTEQDDWFYIEQIKRVLESLGWKIITTDTAGEKITVSAERNKTQKQTEGS